VPGSIIVLLLLRNRDDLVRDYLASLGENKGERYEVAGWKLEEELEGRRGGGEEDRLLLFTVAADKDGIGGKARGLNFGKVARGSYGFFHLAYVSGEKRHSSASAVREKRKKK